MAEAEGRKNSGGQQPEERKNSGGQQPEERKNSGGQHPEERKNSGGQQPDERKNSGGHQQEQRKDSGPKEKERKVSAKSQSEEEKMSSDPPPEERKKSSEPHPEQRKKSGEQQPEERKKSGESHPEPRKNSGEQHPEQRKKSGEPQPEPRKNSGDPKPEERKKSGESQPEPRKKSDEGQPEERKKSSEPKQEQRKTSDPQKEERKISSGSGAAAKDVPVKQRTNSQQKAENNDANFGPPSALSPIEIEAEKRKVVIYNLNPDIPIVTPTGEIRDLSLEIPISADGLSLLASSNYIFIGPGEDEFGGRLYSQFNLMDDNDFRLFRAIETLDIIQKNDKPPKISCCSKKPSTGGPSDQQRFDIVVLGSDGGEAFNIVMKSGVATILYERKPLGHLEQLDGFERNAFPTKYKISDENGDVYQVNSSSVNGTFDISNIISPADSTGKISATWADLNVSIASKYKSTYGIQFPPGLEVNHKALLIAPLFAIYFKFNKPEKPNQKPTGKD